MKNIRRATAIVLGIVTLTSCGPDTSSLLLHDMTIVDGTAGPAFTGSVRVQDGVIVEVGDLTPLRNETIVNGEGRVLAPGFIDTHSHHDRGIHEMRDAVAAVSQGITTVVVGQDGGSHYPLSEAFAVYAATPPAINMASYTGHARLRRMVMDDLQRPATESEIEAMAELLRVDMESGSLGLGTGLEYTPAFRSSTEEVIALAKVAGEYGGRYISHIRSEDRAFWQAVDEILRIGDEADVPVQIAHMKLAMTSLWGRADEAIAKLDSARAAGIDVTADVYPYTYWQSTMTVLVPDGNFTRDAVAFALREVATPNGIIFGRFSPEPSYEGRTLEEIAAERGEDPVTAYLAVLDMAYGPDAPEDADEGIVARSMKDEDIARLYTWEHTNVCTDGELDGPHPRGYGSFTRVLARYVRENGALSLEDAVHKMTQLSARHVGLEGRGVIEVGAAADLVMFDPATVQDRATFDEPHRPSVGIDGVWVNGVRVWEEGAPTGVYPGRALRRGG